MLRFFLVCLVFIIQIFSHRFRVNKLKQPELASLNKIYFRFLFCLYLCCKNIWRHAIAHNFDLKRKSKDNLSINACLVLENYCSRNRKITSQRRKEIKGMRKIHSRWVEISWYVYSYSIVTKNWFQCYPKGGHNNIIR